MYLQRLKHITPRQSDLDLDSLVNRFHQKQMEMEHTAFRERFLEEERFREQQQQKREALLEHSRQMRVKQSEIVAKIQ